MVRFLVLYAQPIDVKAFERHYHEVHVPLVKRLPGLRSYTTSRNASPVRWPDPYYLIAELDWDDPASLQRDFASPPGQEAARDADVLDELCSGIHSMIFELDSPMLAIEAARAEVHQSVEIFAPAGDVWELISDWAGMLRWWLTAEDSGLQGPTLVGCTLVGKPNEVPRTRRMELDNGSVVEVEILYQNNDTRRIHYIKADDPNIRSYVASTYVDEITPTTCKVHVRSSFDVLPPLDPAEAVARLKAVYAAMFEGYQRYFTRSLASS